MATFELQAPDGTTYEIEAPDMAAAARAFKKKTAAPPQPQERSWSDVPGEAVSNIGQSAVNFGKAVAQPFLAPRETVNNLVDVAAGGARRLAQNMLPEAAFSYLDSYSDPDRKDVYTAKADAVGQFYKGRYGGSEEIKKTLATDPVGAAADAAMVLYGGGALTPGRAGSAMSKAASTIDPISNAGRAVGATGRAASSVLGMTTGAGSTPVKSAFEAGRTGNTAFADHMRGTAAMDDVVSMAERGVSDMVKKRSAEYDANNPLSTPEARQPLDTKPIWQKVTSAAGMARFQGVVFNQAAADVLENIAVMMKEFEHAPDGKSALALDKLKQGVYQIAQSQPPNSPSSKIAMDVYHEIGKQIRQQLPAYDKTMGDYSRASDTINEMRRTLSINDRASTDTTMRKLQSVMRNNVNTNYGHRTKLVDELAKSEPDLPYALAGQALNSATPRGLQGITASGTGIAGLTSNPYALAALPLFSPRLVGEASYGAGQSARAVDRIASRLGIDPRLLGDALLGSYGAGQVSTSSTGQ